jgi:ParB-like chromosome segregation protein Spo0J
MPKTLKVHPFAQTFGILQGEELNELREDIRTNGVRVPIVVNKKRDTILDGRNRWMIATELGISNDVLAGAETFKGKDEDIPFEILRLNVFRRHLSEDQRIAYVSKVLGPKLEKAAKERQGQAGKSGSFKKNGNGDKGATVAQLAKDAKSTTYKAQQAEKARKAGLIDDVIEKKMTLKQAAKSVKPKSRKPRKEVSFEDEVYARWKRFLNNWPTTQHQRVFDCVIEFLSDRTPVAKEANVENVAAGKVKAPAKKKAATVRRKK